MMSMTMKFLIGTYTQTSVQEGCYLLYLLLLSTEDDDLIIELSFFPNKIFVF